MKNSFFFLLSFVTMSSIITSSAYAQEWTKSIGIPTEVSITSLQENNGHIIAFGQKMWREGNNFLSEPMSFISENNGNSWKEYININNGNSTANTLLFADNRIISSGRKGESQLDWVGAVCISDDNGLTWKEVEGIPSDISITKIQKWGGQIIAFGMRQWREGMQFFSEPKTFVSTDNGSAWTPFITVTSNLSTINTLMISNGRVITSGREGEAQLDWIGAIYYTDDDGSSWKQADGLASDISVTEIVSYNGGLIAAGQKQWREGMNFLSEAKLYQSKDNGASWTEFLPVTNEISTAQCLIVRDGRVITGGRLGQTQTDWVGAVFYTDF